MGTPYLPQVSPTNTITLATGLQFINPRGWGGHKNSVCNSNKWPLNWTLHTEKWFPGAQHIFFFFFCLRRHRKEKQRLLTTSDLGELTRQPVLTSKLNITCAWHNHIRTTRRIPNSKDCPTLTQTIIRLKVNISEKNME